MIWTLLFGVVKTRWNEGFVGDGNNYFFASCCFHDGKPAKFPHRLGYFHRLFWISYFKFSLYMLHLTERSWNQGHVWYYHINDNTVSLFRNQVTCFDDVKAFSFSKLKRSWFTLLHQWINLGKVKLYQFSELLGVIVVQKITLPYIKSRRDVLRYWTKCMMYSNLIYIVFVTAWM